MADPYRWLEDGHSAETAEWLAAQRDRFTDQRLNWGCVDAFRAALDRLTGYGEYSPPVWRGERAFCTRRDGDHTVLSVTEGSAERVLLDTRAVDPTGGTTLEGWTADPRGRLLSCLLFDGGDERPLLRVLDVDRGCDAEPPVRLPRYTDIVWVGDGAFCYTAGDDDAGDTVRLHRPGTPQESDLEVFPAVFGETTTIELSGGGGAGWVVLTATRGLSDDGETWVADVRHGAVEQPAWRRLDALVGGAATVVPHGDWALYALVDADGDGDGPGGRIVRLALAAGDAAGWSLAETVVAAQPGKALEGFVVLSGGALAAPVVVAAWTVDGHAVLTRHDAGSGACSAELPLPGHGLVTALTARDDGGPTAWFTYCDALTPPTVFTYDAATGECAPWRRGAQVRAGELRVEETTYASTDGVRVPMVVVGPAADGGGPLPTVLQAYGAFGHPSLGHYYAAALAWAEQGGRFAIAGVRGGGEHGEDWHRAGAREHKRQGVEDFLAAADDLVARGWTTRDALGFMGHSAGGLLVAAAVTDRPDACRAAVCSSPLTDMVRYELTGLGEYWSGEFGSREVPAELDWLLGYSPYHRVRPGTAYPAVLVLASDVDTRVDPMHARKFCAALQYATTSAHPVLLRTDGNGHAQRARGPRLANFADWLGFLAHETGLGAPEPADTGSNSRPAVTDSRGEEVYSSC